VKLPRLDNDNKYRREIADLYIKNINIPVIQLPITDYRLPIIDNLSHVWHLFVIRHSKRDKLQKYFAENDIQTLIHYPIPPHKQKAYEKWNNFSFPITEKIHNEIISLPISQVISNMDVQALIGILNKYEL